MEIAAVIYRLAVALWVGGVAIFTLVLTPIIFRSNSRDVAGRIVGTLFPGYFRWGLGCGAVALLFLLARGERRFTAALVLLIVMLALTSVQAFIIEPRAAALKREIVSFETTSKDDPLRREFSRLHAVSAVCNLAVLGGGVALVALF